MEQPQASPAFREHLLGDIPEYSIATVAAVTRPSPGPAAVAVTLRDFYGNELGWRAEYLGPRPVTTHRAELIAIQRALDILQRAGVEHALIQSASEYAVNLVSEQVPSEDLSQEAHRTRERVQRLGTAVRWVPRELAHPSHQLADEELERAGVRSVRGFDRLLAHVAAHVGTVRSVAEPVVELNSYPWVLLHAYSRRDRSRGALPSVDSDSWARAAALGVRMVLWRPYGTLTAPLRPPEIFPGILAERVRADLDGGVEALVMPFADLTLGAQLTLTAGGRSVHALHSGAGESRRPWRPAREVIDGWRA